MQGWVTLYNTTRGFGFIRIKDGAWHRDFFFHHSGLEDGILPNRGDLVEFLLDDGDRGEWIAVNVRRIVVAKKQMAAMSASGDSGEYAGRLAGIGYTVTKRL
jgi:cold shock CspA family protein